MPLLLALLVFQARAEKFLDLHEAEKLSFPNATAFKPQPFQLSKDQLSQLEKSTGLKGQLRLKFWIVLDGSKPVGVFATDQVIGKHELIDYAVALKPSGEILRVEILEYRENFGAEIKNEKWRGQFAGKNSSSRLKLNDDVYNISGATMSCKHVTEGIKRLLAVFKLALADKLVADGLPNTAK